MLNNHSRIHFNLSHTEGSAACGIGSRPIGVDIQRLTTFKPGIAKKYMKEENFSDLSPSEKDMKFTRAWCEMESYVKFTGEGLAGLQQSVPMEDGLITETIPIDDFYLCYVAQEKLEIEEVTISQILELLPHLSKEMN